MYCWRHACVLALVGTAFLSACSPSSPAIRLTHARTLLNRGNSADVSSLDPDEIVANWEANVVGDCIVGLTTEGPDGAPIPGAAESWESSADKKTWTFHLRQHLWSDGVPVTAEDFVFAWRRILDPKRAAQYASYLYLVKNARAVNAGTLPATALGISAPDDRTLVVQLEDPAPFLPEWLTHQTTYPVPRHVVLTKGDAWAKPGNYVANGPYIPVEWVPNGHITLIKNPRFYDARNVRIEKVIYYPTTDTQAAMKQMQAGELDTQQTLPLSEISWLRKNMGYALSLKPYLGVSYIIFNFARRPLADRRLREALSLAFDRDAYMNDILKLYYPPAYSFVPPLTANYPSGAAVDFKGLSFSQRLEKARALMAELGYGPQNHFHTTYTTFSSPDNNLIAAATQAMMKGVYVDVDIVKTDAVTYYRTLGAHDFDLAPTGWVGDFNDASTFLDLLDTGNGNNYGSYSNPAFDGVYREAKQQTDLRKRGLLMRKAEQAALDDDAIIPVRFLVTLELVQPYVKGWNVARPNLRNFHRTRWLWLDPKVVAQ